jgi:hypothetical protein
MIKGNTTVELSLPMSGMWVYSKQLASVGNETAEDCQLAKGCDKASRWVRGSRAKLLPKQAAVTSTQS